MSNKKMFALNEDGVTEWVVAENKNQALSFAAGIWGIDCVLEYFKEYLQDVPDGTVNDFIDSFAKEVPRSSIFTHCEYGDNCKDVITRTIGEFLDDTTKVPSYFAYQE
ncbi:hypothetical protein [Desulfoscipio gibsoniae]